MLNRIKNNLSKFFPIRIGRFLIINTGAKKLTEDESLFIHPQLKLKKAKRDDVILKFCAGMRVLHFGFLDYPITEDKLVSGNLLHSKIRKVANSLYGIDVDSKSLDFYRHLTGDYNNMSEDILSYGSDVSFLANSCDVIIFPEVLEHISNPGAALLSLKQILLINPGSRLLISVPNAYSLLHFSSACNEIELVHADHYFYFSPTTLRKLLTDSGFNDIEISLYSWYDLNAKTPGICEHGVISVCTV